MNPLSERYRCPDEFLQFATPQAFSGPAKLIHDLRFERLVERPASRTSLVLSDRDELSAPTHFEGRLLTNFHLRCWNDLRYVQRPVDRRADLVFEELLSTALQNQNIESIPFIWFWPDGHSACATLLHDVESEAGRDLCADVMDIEEAHQIRSSFQIVPRGRYRLRARFLQQLRSRGFEINIEGLDSDAKLFADFHRFLSWVEGVSAWSAEYGALGFRSPLLIRNAEWLLFSSFVWDMSFPNLGYLEPERPGCSTVFPYFMGPITELPLTTTQDYSLFRYATPSTLELWKAQIDAILNANGLISLLIHPEFLIDDDERSTYLNLLNLLDDYRESRNVWIARPSDIDAWWRARNQTHLRRAGSQWVLEGPAQDHARIAHAHLVDGRVHYTIEEAPARLTQSA